jgi:hypothetical protein
VEQLSLPYRIALVALLVVGALWFVVLRPKSGSEATPAATPAPGVTGLANDVSKAKGAVDASNAGAARTDAAANAVGSAGSAAKSTATKPAATAKPAKPAAAAKPAKPKAAAKPALKPAPKPAKPGLADDAAPGDPSRPLLADVDAGKVVVVLFWNKDGSDDRATRSALRAVDRHHGKVVATAIPVSDVGKYEAITRGAQILESPTVLIIGAGGKARAITGYTEASEINQAVSDIGGKGFEAKKAFELKGFARVADDVCRDSDFAIDQKTDFPTTPAALVAFLNTGATEMAKARARLQRTPAKSGAEKSLKTAMLAYATQDATLAKSAATKVKGGANPAEVVTSFVNAQAAASKKMVAAAKKAHLVGCYADR